jgi:hypothetical protein
VLELRAAHVASDVAGKAGYDRGIQRGVDQDRQEETLGKLEIPDAGDCAIEFAAEAF